MVAELDLAQDLAETEETDLAGYVIRFLDGDFATYDADVARLKEDLPAPITSNSARADTANDEIVGWSALFESENFEIAQERFERCWTAAKEENNLREMAALHGWHRAKALYLDGLHGNRGAEAKAFQVLEEAIRRGGRSSWFNRMRASLNRARDHADAARSVADQEYPDAVIHSLGERLERLGTSGGKYQKFVDDLRSRLESGNHAQFQEALEDLGTLLGYRARRPKYGAAADCIWRGEFGMVREYLAFEAKIEHEPANLITVEHLGQAHIQHSRAEQEYGTKGYSVRVLLVTHLTQLAPDAQSSVGPIRLLQKDVVLALCARVCDIMTAYRSCWNIDDVPAMRAAAASIGPRLPKTGWLLRAVDRAAPWVSESDLLAEWDARD